ncbi:MAG TPA: aspartyl protease family protein [Chitinophagaceae bacterium]|nr:aspartyl protease family protein [Chitinophagaceae bacterium]
MSKRLLLYISVSIALCNALVAQEEFIEPAAKYLTRVHFTQLTGGVILLQGQFGDFPDTMNFILDTGSGGISLDSTTATQLKLTPVPSDKTIRGIAGIRLVSFVNNEKLKLGDLTIDSLDFHINNYDILTAVYGERIDGIIGYSLLKRFIFKIDYDSSRIDIFSKGTFKYPKGGYMFRPLIATLPIQTARVKDEKTIQTRFLYDIGAGLCMMLSEDFVQDSMLLNKKRKLYYKEAEGLGGKIDMQMTVIKELKFGPYRFRNVPVYIFKDEYNVTSYPFLGGIIGNDILRRFNCILNYDKRDFYLTPNSHFLDAFDYSYSGIELYFINGQIVVGDVAQQSPAEKSGLKEGDIVISINNVFNQSLTQLKSALQNANERIKMIVRRGTELKVFEFKVRTIF